MFHLKRVIFLLIILSFSVVETFGSGQNRAGTAAAPELRIPIGARYLAMVGSPIASVTGLEAIYWNPAGVDFSPTSASALFSYRSYLADMSVNFAAVSGKLGDLGSFGLAFRSFNIGDINVTTMDQPDGTGQIMSPGYFVLGLTYSKKLTDRVSVGVNFNLINETIDRVSSSGFSFDVGVQYKNLFEVDGFDLGVVVKNLGGSMKYSGNGLYVMAVDPNSNIGPTYYAIEGASAELPSEISIGLSYLKKFDEDNSVLLAGSYVSNNYTYDDYKIGAEYSYKDIFFARAGYLFTPQATDAEPNIFSDYSLGLGVNLEKFSGLNLAVDYAYVPAKYFDGNHVLAISLGF